MAEDKVTILIDVDAKGAQAAIELFGKESAKVLQKTEKQSDSLFKTLKGAAGPVTAALATIVGAYQTLSNAIEQAAADAKLTRQIEASLRATDEASQEAITSVLEFADAIKETTGLSDDLAKETYITAKSFGVTSEEAKKLTKAAIDLAAATGVDAETAVRQLGGTLDGSIGKVGNLGAEFRNLTEAQLKSGAAVDLVAQKFGGSAEKELNTYNGSINQLKNATDDFLKVFGRIVIESDLVKGALAGVANAINSTTKALTDTRDTSENVEKSFGFVAALGGNLEAASRSVLKAQERVALAGIEFGKTSNKISDGFAGIIESEKGATKATADFEDQLKSLAPPVVVKRLELTGKALEEATKKAKELADEGVKFKEGIFSGFGAAAETEAAKAQQALIKSFELEKKGALSTQEAYDIRLRIATDFNAKRVTEAEKSAKEEADKVEKAAVEAKAEIEKIAASPVTFFLETNAGDFRGAGVALASAFDKALSGRQGATQLFSSTIGAFADKVLPGIGGLVGSIIGKLAAGPEQAKAFVKEFIGAIPDIIIAIVDALPEALSGIIEKVFSPEFLQRLGLAIGRSMLFVFTAGLSRFAEEWGRKIGEYMLTPFREWLEPLFARLSAVFEPFNNAINRLSEIFRPATDAMNRLAKAIENWDPSNPGGGGGVGGALGGLFERAGKALGFAEGGIVPMYAAEGAFVPKGTDTVPAMLTPGELVVPRDMVGELGAFLSSQNNTGGDGQAAVLAAILSAVQAPIVVKTEAKVNQNAFADIILQLNRQNARLAV